MKIKIIDLLNKIAKGEEVPKRIKWNDDEYSYVNDTCKNYANDYEDFMSVVDGYCLNDEIEIIEEVEDKEYEDIEELGVEYDNDGKLSRTINALIRNQNKIIERMKRDE
jgi:hypothetical protein